MSQLTKGKGSKGKGNGPYYTAHRVPWRGCLDAAEQRFLCAFAELHFLQYAYGLHQGNGTGMAQHDYEHAVMLLWAQVAASRDAIECLRVLRITQATLEPPEAAQTFLGWAQAHHIQLQGILGCAVAQAWRTLEQINALPEAEDGSMWV